MLNKQWLHISFILHVQQFFMRFDTMKKEKLLHMLTNNAFIYFRIMNEKSLYEKFFFYVLFLTDEMKIKKNIFEINSLKLKTRITFSLKHQ